MWHSLRKSVLAIDPLVRLCIAVSCGLHIVLTMAILIAAWLQPAKQIIINKDAYIPQEVTIIIDPRASVTGLVTQKSAPSNGNNSQSNTAVKKEAQKSATTLVAEKKATARVAKKIMPKKTVPKPKPKQSVKPTPKKEVKAVKRNVEKPKPQPKPEIKKVIEKPMPTPSLVDESAAPSGCAANVPIGVDGPIMIARSASDAAALTLQCEVQQELLRVWIPPVGVDASISCQIKVVLGADGTLTSLEIIKPSGMRLFDVSARAALQQAVWPRGVWGTTLELCLQ
jgi:outer membrane biosynthesis protein TonB